MKRVVNKDLEAVVLSINIATNSSVFSHEIRDGKTFTRVGNFHLSFAYGGVALHRMVSMGGATIDVFERGHITKRELLGLMYAFRRGLECPKGSSLIVLAEERMKNDNK